MRNFITFTFCQIENVEVKEDDMHRACSTCRGEEKCISDFGGNARRKKDN
jgi:hypothetical protein